MPSRREEPLLRTNCFEVSIGDRELGFAQVGRLSSETDVLDAPRPERSIAGPPSSSDAPSRARPSCTTGAGTSSSARTTVETSRSASCPPQAARSSMPGDWFGHGRAGGRARRSMHEQRHRLRGARGDLRRPRLARPRPHHSGRLTWPCFATAPMPSSTSSSTSGPATPMGPRPASRSAAPSA